MRNRVYATKCMSRDQMDTCGLGDGVHLRRCLYAVHSGSDVYQKNDCL